MLASSLLPIVPPLTTVSTVSIVIRILFVLFHFVALYANFVRIRPNLGLYLLCYFFDDESSLEYDSSKTYLLSALLCLSGVFSVSEISEYLYLCFRGDLKLPSDIYSSP